MKNKIRIIIKSSVIILMIIAIFFPNIAYSQWQDGGNFDFSNNDYSGWKGWKARNNSAEGSNVNTIVFSAWITANTPTDLLVDGSSCFQIYSNLSQTDTRIPQITVIPPGYTHSSRINADVSYPDGNANMLTYDLLIDQDNCLLTFNFAIILEDPGHSGFANPFFKIDVIELDYMSEVELGLVDPCATFYALGQTPPPPGFQAQGDYIWQNWKQVSMNLSDFQGSKVRIKIILSSCTYQVHSAHGYFVGKVGPAELTVNACGNADTVAVIEAPPGFQRYEWISRTSDFTDYDNQFASGPSILTSEATATASANNKLVILQGDAYANHQYFAVKLTSPSSNSTIPGCEAYIKARVQSLKPILEFDTVLDCSLKVEFQNTSSNGSGFDEVSDSLIYVWDFGDESDNRIYNSKDTNTDANRSPIHQYTASGTYTVKLTALAITATDTCISEKTMEIEVPDTPDFDVQDSTICIGTEMEVVVLNSSMPNAVFTWREGPSDTDPVIHEGNSYTAVFDQENTLYVTASEANTACTRTKSVTISVQGFPDIEVRGDTLICEGNSTTLTARDNSGLTEAMQWTLNQPSNPPVMTNPSTNPTYTITPSTNTTVYLIAKTSQGCMSWKSVNITVVDPIVYADKYKVCPGDEVTLTGERALEYSWTADPEDPTLTTETSPDPVKVNPE
ncbi:MAG: PKD domain-containing protein, partial [Bacteroidales bacterium]|nr:PKD domain-containing protein [Bacteroidales bacterium]